jgi:DNA replicative helicase MCM subunit Mcm2 (Cdc46/Mcm family)
MDMRSAGISSKVIAATPRQLESLIRLAEAHAKMRYSMEVRRLCRSSTLHQHSLEFNFLNFCAQVDEYDVDQAIRLMRVSTQKSATDPRTGQIDMDLLSAGTTVRDDGVRCMLLFVGLTHALLQHSSRARAQEVLKNVRSFLQSQTRANVSLRDVLDMLRTTMPQENISDADVRT